MTDFTILLYPSLYLTLIGILLIHALCAAIPFIFNRGKGGASSLDGKAYKTAMALIASLGVALHLLFFTLALIKKVSAEEIFLAIMISACAAITSMRISEKQRDPKQK